jgi:curved DNA-binding protein CbpA
MTADPYATLGLDQDASDAEVRAAYRRLVQLHHPDHNGGSAESARRFEEVQEAYARVRELRAGAGGRSGSRSASQARTGARDRPSSPPPSDADLSSRLAEMERELREAAAARERARRAAREAAAAARAETPRPTDEELGYVNTDDSFSKILGDFRDELFGRAEELRDANVRDRVADAIDDLAAKLRGEPPKPD